MTRIRATTLGFRGAAEIEDCRGRRSTFDTNSLQSDSHSPRANLPETIEGKPKESPFGYTAVDRLRALGDRRRVA